VLDPQLTLVDNPWLADRFGCAVFDREGTPTRPLTAIDSGILRGFFLDGYAGKALERPSSGHAAGGPSSAPTVGSHCLCLHGGTESVESLLKRATDQAREFLVLHRYSGQVDPVTGDFSGVAKGGEWWHGGERAYCVKETLISGNIFDAFRKSLVGISKETEVIDCGEESPTLVVDGISVTSG
jgi:PmbA protein